jgi:formate hydrogenlyase subunit 6/NADH:ubiquinone oxidoreductase subunit I
MAHRTIKTSYARLTDRLNQFPQGAPPSETLFKLLKLLFSEREAALVAELPIKPFTASQAARIWKLPEAEARRVLDELASRAILLDTLQPDGRQTYVLPPPMAGFFEFSMMRVRTDVDQQALGELFYQYLNVEEDFIRCLFTHGETQLGRVFVHEPVLSNDNALHVLDYERASQVIRTASHIGVGVCYCRHKMAHIGRDCTASKDICLTFNGCAESLTRHGVARRVDAAEGLDLLQTAQGQGLVQFGENVRQHVAFICNCCGCCCEAMIAARRFALLHPVHTSRFLPQIDAASCTGCGKCVSACPVEAMTLVSSNDAHQPNRKQARLNAELCLGCGVCLRTCRSGSLTLTERAERILTPVDTVHRSVVMAVERGQLQNLIFDNDALFSHRAMAAILGAILKLPPAQRLLASRQVKSRYLEALCARVARTL